jgi:hypothetical protein
MGLGLTDTVFRHGKLEFCESCGFQQWEDMLGDGTIPAQPERVKLVMLGASKFLTFQIEFSEDHIPDGYPIPVEAQDIHRDEPKFCDGKGCERFLGGELSPRALATLYEMLPTMPSKRADEFRFVYFTP